MKIFFILAVILAALMILIIIIAVSRPSFEERRESESKKDPQRLKEAKNKFGFGWIVWLIVLLAGAWVLETKIHFSAVSSTAYSIAADAQDIWPRIGETIKVKIYPDCLSGWINLPPGAQFLIDAPGEVEYFFWSGKRIFIKDKNTQWAGEVPNCSFRMRGSKGEATITIQ